MVLRRRPRREARHSRLWQVLVGLGLIVGALIVGWRVDETRQDSEIRQGAVVAGVDIGGLEPEEAVIALEPVVQEVAETIIELHIELQFQDQIITITAAELGISLDAEQTLAEADTPPPSVVRPAAWLFDLFASRDVSPAVTTDLGTLATTVDPYTDPETPRIELVGGAFRPVLSTDVPVPDMELLAERLEEAVQSNLGGRAVVEVPIGGMEPADPFAVALATALAVRANNITQGGVSLQLEGTAETFSIGERALRQFVILEGEQHDTYLALAPRVGGTLASLFVGIGGEGRPATIGLDDAGNVTIADGETGFKCCHETAPQALLAGMHEGQQPIVLPAAPAPHPRGREWAESLGITDVVGEFTTNFKAGQDRVINIARISELTRGAIIEPGQRFSVNEFVGPRTMNDGFVPAGMILNGVFVDSVGGGVSQYATTLFNAVFFAGLDFISYQSHTIYLSRYPYGREATVSHPAPDLVFENITPYGVMLWPTTTDTSITVKLYSTPWVLSEQTGQTSSTRGTSCTRVVTERTRTWLEDGRTETDTVWAQYRPEGLKCDGTPSVTTTTTSTTVPPEGGEDQGAGDDNQQVEPSSGNDDNQQVEPSSGNDDNQQVEPSSGNDDNQQVEPSSGNDDNQQVEPSSGNDDNQQVEPSSGNDDNQQVEPSSGNDDNQQVEPSSGNDDNQQVEPSSGNDDNQQGEPSSGNDDNQQGEPSSGNDDNQQGEPSSGNDDNQQGEPSSGNDDNQQVEPSSGNDDNQQGEPSSGNDDNQQGEPSSGNDDNQQVEPSSGNDDNQQGEPSSGNDDNQQGEPSSGNDDSDRAPATTIPGE